MKRVSSFTYLGLMTLIFAGVTVLSGCGGEGVPVDKIAYQATVKKDGVILNSGSIVFKVKMYIVIDGETKSRDYVQTIGVDGKAEFTGWTFGGAVRTDFEFDSVTAKFESADGTQLVAEEELESESINSGILRRKAVFNLHPLKIGSLDGVKNLLNKFNRGNGFKDISREAVSSRHESGRSEGQLSAPSQSLSSSSAAI